ncbi:Nucleolar protein 10 [Hordeum vulgare]|nr:Nucleolar protein 10 [Hordeum vulgare]
MEPAAAEAGQMGATGLRAPAREAEGGEIPAGSRGCRKGWGCRIQGYRSGSKRQREETRCLGSGYTVELGLRPECSGYSIYDIRMSSPRQVKDHMYGSPILNIKWHQTLNSTEPKLITADKHIVRVWDPNIGNNMTIIEPDNGSINDVCIFSNSGLMLLALDNSQIPAHFIPALGPAPN